MGMFFSYLLRVTGGPFVAFALGEFGADAAARPIVNCANGLCEVRGMKVPVAINFSECSKV
jgi:hypothetical protein